MKKTYIILIATIITISFSGSTFASTINSIGHEKAIVVEVESEEEFLNYPRNPNNKYRFIIQNPISPMAVCYMCGRPNMGLATVRDEWSRIGKACPGNQWGVIDHFITDRNWQIERCTACAYQVKVKDLPDTYRSLCRNTDVWDDIEWEVRKEWYMKDGYDIHQVYDYWMYGIFK